MEIEKEREKRKMKGEQMLGERSNAGRKISNLPPAVNFIFQYLPQLTKSLLLNLFGITREKTKKSL